MIKILLVAGARPNFMKVMPLIREFKKHPRRIKYTFLHTGQHYDFNMSANFFKDLGMPAPDIYLGVGPGRHGIQTAKVIEGVEKILLKKRFNLVIVVGDVNSTLAAALAATKAGIKVAHVEAGLRSFDRSMPEEINRVLTDHISDYLFTTEDCGTSNLLKEGVPKSKIFFTGDIMVDSHYLCKDKISKSEVLKRLKLDRKKFCLVTIHRPSNVDGKRDLGKVAGILEAVNKRIKIVFPVHPRTRKMLQRYGLNLKEMVLTEPLGFVDFHKLLISSRLVMTDSGGIQQEATVLNIPCLTLRTTTERPVTIARGTNELTGPDKQKVLKAVDEIMRNRWKKAIRPARWDGRTAKRITEIILRKEAELCSGD